MATELPLDALGEPFDPREVKFKPQAVSGARAMAIGYVDARAIMDRLDSVVGPAGWQDDYECLPDGGVVCRLKLLVDGQWIVKVDVGSPSEQPDEGDRRKAAFSDSLKRAAVHWGIGRYLYRLPLQWVDYDPQKKRFAKAPQLPSWALPKGTKAAKPQTNGEPPGDLKERGIAILTAAAEDGMAALERAWSTLTIPQKHACQAELATLKPKAADADLVKDVPF